MGNRTYIVPLSLYNRHLRYINTCADRSEVLEGLTLLHNSYFEKDSDSAEDRFHMTLVENVIHDQIHNKSRLIFDVDSSVEGDYKLIWELFNETPIEMLTRSNLNLDRSMDLLRIVIEEYKSSLRNVLGGAS